MNMKKTYRVENLCCANCAAKIERAINKLDAVSQATLNFMTLRLTVESETENWDGMMQEIQKAFSKVEPKSKVIVK